MQEICTVHGPDALKALEVPKFDGHVRRARSQQLSSLIKGDVLHRVSVTLQGTLEIPSLVVPNLQNNATEQTYTLVSKGFKIIIMLHTFKNSLFSLSKTQVFWYFQNISIVGAFMPHSSKNSSHQQQKL